MVLHVAVLPKAQWPKGQGSEDKVIAEQRRRLQIARAEKTWLQLCAAERWGEAGPAPRGNRRAKETEQASILGPVFPQ